MYGSAFIDGDVEFGLGRRVGILVGGGLVGANAGMTLHVMPKKHVDLDLAATADYMAGLQAVEPDLSFNIRGFFGRSARVGVCGKIGIALITVDRYVAGMRYRVGNPMLTYAVGVAIKAKK